MASWITTINGIPNSFNKLMGGRLDKLKIAAPGIELGLSIVCMAGSVITAAHAGLKSRDILDEHKKMMDDIDEAHEVNPEEFTEDDVREDKKVARAKTTVAMGKLYLPSFLLAGASAGLAIHSHKVMVKRVDMAVAAFNAVNAAYLSQKESIEKHNKDVEEFNSKENKEKAKVTFEPVTPDASPYAVFFEKYRADGHLNPNWINHSDTMLAFLEGQEVVANRLLHARGHLFLNDIFHELLGLPDTQIGALVGWIDGEGDDAISFGLNNMHNIRMIGENNDEFSILLDFNVQGAIYDKI